MPINEDELKKKWIEQQMIHVTCIANEQRLAFKRERTQKFIWKKVHDNINLGLGYCDIMDIALEVAVNAVLTFKCQNPEKQWVDILAGDQTEINKLWKAIHMSLQWRLSNIDPLAKRTYENKTKTHFIIKPLFSNLDQVHKGLNEEIVTLLDNMTDDHILWGIKGYQKNEFNEWFWNHANDVLTSKQLKFMQDFCVGKESDRYGYMKRIRAKMLAEQKRQGYELAATHLERQINKKIKILRKLISVVESDDALPQQNLQVQDWVKEYFELDWIDEMAYQALGIRDYQKMIRALRNDDLIPTLIIYKIAEVAFAKLDYLQAFDTYCETYDHHFESTNSVEKNLEQEPLYPSRFKTKVRVLLPTGIMVDEETYFKNKKWCK